MEYPVFTCPACRTVEQIQELRKESVANLDQLAEIQRRSFEELSNALSEGLNALSEGLSGIASVIEWGFEEVIWQLQQQTKVLQSIDHTLKTPGQTQAKEWRQIAEELRSRGVLDESEKFFVKSLETNPLDYRTYIGLAHTYLQMDKFDEAKAFLEKSLPHAPKKTKEALSEQRRKILQKREQPPRSIEEELEIQEELDQVFHEILYDPDRWDTVITIQDQARAKEDLERKRCTRRIALSAYQREKTIRDLSIPETFDYKSYSYRLIGHIYACKEDYHRAAPALQSAIELSPTYYVALYDLAQYSAQMRDPETCLSLLEKLLTAEPLCFHLVEKERNFEPIRENVQDLLDSLMKNASDGAKENISKSEEVLERIREAISGAEAARHKSRASLKHIDRPDVIGLSWASRFYRSVVEKSLLSKAKELLRSGDYAELLELGLVWREFLGIAGEVNEKVEKVRQLCEEIYTPWYSRIWSGVKAPEWWLKEDFSEVLQWGEMLEHRSNKAFAE